MANNKERVHALEKHMEFLLKIPVDKLEDHSNECLQYRGLSELELEESYKARKLSFNLLPSENASEDFLKKFYEIQVNCNIVDKDNFLANDTLFKRKDNCTYAGKLIFIPITSTYQFDLDIIRNYYYYNYEKVVGSVTKRDEFMEWLEEKLKSSCKIELKSNPEKVNAYVEKHFKMKDESNTNSSNFNNTTSSNSSSDLLNHKSSSSYYHTSTKWSDDGTQTEQKRTSAPTMVKERPDTGYLFTNAPKQEEKVSEPVKEEVATEVTKEIENEVVEVTRKEDKAEVSDKWKTESKKFKEDCIETIRKITHAYENNVFKDKTNTELKEIAKNFIEHTKDLALEGDDWVQEKTNPKIEQALKNITSDYRRLVCCRQKDAKAHGCVVCPSPHENDVRKNPLQYVNRSLEFLVRH